MDDATLNDVFDNLEPAPADVGQAQDVQTEGAEGGSQNDTPTGDAAPPDSAKVVEGWQAKFKNPEEMYDKLQKMEESYGKLRPAFTKKAMELAELKRKSTSSPKADAPQQPQVQQPQQAQAPQSNPAVKLIQDYLMQQSAKLDELEMVNKIQQMAMEEEDFMDVLPDVDKILEEDPSLWGLKDPLRAAYSMVKVSKAKERMAEIAAAGQAQKQATRQSKVEHSLTDKPSTPTVSKTPADSILSGILDAAGAGSKTRNIFR